jgi:hypothetical protein
MELKTNKDDEYATLAWLEDALAQAFELRRPELWAYLEAVLEEVLFEVELATGSSWGQQVVAATSVTSRIV